MSGILFEAKQYTDLPKDSRDKLKHYFFEEKHIDWVEANKEQFLHNIGFSLSDWVLLSSQTQNKEYNLGIKNLISSGWLQNKLYTYFDKLIENNEVWFDVHSLSEVPIPLKHQTLDEFIDEYSDDRQVDIEFVDPDASNIINLIIRGEAWASTEAPDSLDLNDAKSFHDFTTVVVDQYNDQYDTAELIINHSSSAPKKEKISPIIPEDFEELVMETTEEDL